MLFDYAIAVPRENYAVIRYKNCADRHLASVGSRLRLFKCDFKKIFVYRHDMTCGRCPPTLLRETNKFEGFLRDR